MLNKNEFIEAVKRDIAEYLPETARENLRIDDTVVVKINDQKLHGLIFREEGSDAAPTFYVDDMFRRYEDGADLGMLMTELAGAYSDAGYAVRPPEVDLKWDSVRDSLTVRLLEVKRNKEFLANMPYVNVGSGLAVIADINMESPGMGEWRIAVNHDVLEQLGVSREDLFFAAMDNAVLNEPPVLTDMTAALFSPEKVNLLDREAPVDPEDIGNMYVLTTNSANLGAAALFYPDVREKAADVIGSDYYVLPSSLHEVILVPDRAGIDPKELQDMVKQANRTVVEPQDILSDEVYHFSREERRLDRVGTEHERASIVAEAR